MCIITLMEILSQVPSLQTLKDPHPALRAALFDMDGTLFNTEPLHAQIFEALAQSLHIKLPNLEEIHHQFKGMTDFQVLLHARNWPGFPQDMSFEEFIGLKNERLLTLIAESDPRTWTKPAVAGLLQEMRQGEFSVGLVTSSERVITHALLEKSDYKKYFDLIITLQDVKEPKPHPGPYLKAMQQLNLGRLECVIFEDSPTGLKAAQESGCRSLKVEWWD
jgi:beta-phosphoglucomutase